MAAQSRKLHQQARSFRIAAVLFFIAMVCFLIIALVENKPLYWVTFGLETFAWGAMVVRARQLQRQADSSELA